ncbi:hypothetical protein PF010_g21540 [Phytophthora fragariae]|uniref:Uncharacterized protein n=2 Tax=Phytophthora fragariae TaxID=53985 RepID=A0A6G0N4W0_9STRA|nr:hypothetical protein PF010_g21540 [Phytophthora fragariae]KAE9192751.1 hypothetical protein PF004_g21210 [Phytophthora fragariae]
MFDATTEDAIETLDTAIDEAPKIEPYLRCFAGDSGAANSLLARYELPYELPYNYDVRLVSDYVVRKLATLMGPRLVRDFKRACNANPSTRGFNLEAWFFAELSHNDLAWSVYVESKLQQRQWGRSTIVFFDPDKYPIGVSLDGPTWMAPAKWNQGGYDAVFIDKAEQLVRFVQVTRAEHHTFDPIYFVMLLNRLVAGGLNQVAVVELCFVVPMDRLKAFRPPLSQEDFEKTVEQVACSESRATWSSPEHTLKNCSAKVMVIGVKCEISN